MTTKNSPASRLVSSLFSGDLRFLSVPAFSFRALLSDGPRDFTFKSDNRVFPATEGARENETRRDESRAAAAAISAFSLPCWFLRGRKGGCIRRDRFLGSERQTQLRSIQDGRSSDRRSRFRPGVDFSKTVEIGRDFFNAIRPSLAWQGLYPELLRMSPPPVWISPPVVTLPKGWCTQSTHLPHYGTVGAKRQPFRARLLSAWRGEARRGVVLGRFAPTTKAWRGPTYI